MQWVGTTSRTGITEFTELLLRSSPGQGHDVMYARVLVAHYRSVYALLDYGVAVAINDAETRVFAVVQGPLSVQSPVLATNGC